MAAPIRPGTAAFTRMVRELAGEDLPPGLSLGMGSVVARRVLQRINDTAEKAIVDGLLNPIQYLAVGGTPAETLTLFEAAGRPLSETQVEVLNAAYVTFTGEGDPSEGDEPPGVVVPGPQAPDPDADPDGAEGGVVGEAGEGVDADPGTAPVEPGEAVDDAGEPANPEEAEGPQAAEPEAPWYDLDPTAGEGVPEAPAEEPEAPIEGAPEPEEPEAPVDPVVDEPGDPVVDEPGEPEPEAPVEEQPEPEEVSEAPEEPPAEEVAAEEPAPEAPVEPQEPAEAPAEPEAPSEPEAPVVEPEAPQEPTVAEWMEEELVVEEPAEKVAEDPEAPAPDGIEG